MPLPSERIEEKAIEILNKGIDPMFNGGHPDIGDWISAIIQFLDEQAEPLSKEKLEII